jgi:hypothetical protein
MRTTLVVLVVLFLSIASTDSRMRLILRANWMRVVESIRVMDGSQISSYAETRSSSLRPSTQLRSAKQRKKCAPS